MMPTDIQSYTKSVNGFVAHWFLLILHTTYGPFILIGAAVVLLVILFRMLAATEPQARQTTSATRPSKYGDWPK